MSNGEVCCILGVCCPPGSAEQRQALAQMILAQRPQFSPAQTEAAADRVLHAHSGFRDVVALIDQSDEQAG